MEIKIKLSVNNNIEIINNNICTYNIYIVSFKISLFLNYNDEQENQ